MNEYFSRVFPAFVLYFQAVRCTPSWSAGFLCTASLIQEGNVHVWLLGELWHTRFK